MGCTYEIFSLKTNKYIDECEAMFNKEFENSFYWGKDWDTLCVEPNGNGGGEISFDNEPFFKQSCMEDSVKEFFKMFCAKYQDVVADMTYYTEFSVDASSQDLKYHYENGIMKGSTVYGIGDTFYLYCEECGYEPDDEDNSDDEPLFTIDTFDPSVEYHCPNCGALLSVEDWDKEEETFDIKEYAERHKNDDWMKL